MKSSSAVPSRVDRIIVSSLHSFDLSAESARRAGRLSTVRHDDPFETRGEVNVPEMMTVLLVI
jgi:hypothetical protein